VAGETAREIILSGQVSWARDGYMNLDRRLVRQEAKFDLIEKMAAPG
jgi:hypothetical protein